MKKSTLIIIAVLALLCIGLYSCKGTQDCPAYSSTSTEQVENNG